MIIIHGCIIHSLEEKKLVKEKKRKLSMMLSMVESINSPDAVARNDRRDSAPARLQGQLSGDFIAFDSPSVEQNKKPQPQQTEPRSKGFSFRGQLRGVRDAAVCGTSNAAGAHQSNAAGAALQSGAVKSMSTLCQSLQKPQSAQGISATYNLLELERMSKKAKRRKS